MTLTLVTIILDAPIWLVTRFPTCINSSLVLSHTVRLLQLYRLARAIVISFEIKIAERKHLLLERPGKTEKV